MKSKFMYSVSAVLLLALVAAGCSSGSSGGGATARTQVTTGVITGFGSVFVNGIEFKKSANVPDTQVATFKFDDTAHPQTDLKIGMIVTVKGAVDPATNTGEFEAIEFQPELRGPLDAQTLSATANTIKVMGHDVVISATTKLEGITGMADLQTRLASAKHPELEVSGRVDSTGKFQATRVALKSDDFGASGKAEIHGTIAGTPAPSASGFTIGDVAVVVDGTTILSNMTTAGFTAGAAVEVKGTLSNGVLTATRIEGNHGVGEGVEVEDNVSLQGIASGALSGGSFVLNGPNGPVTIACDAATVFRGGAGDSSIIGANATLEVEGSLQADGSVLASKVKSESEIETESHGGTDSGGDGGGGGGGADDGTSHT